MKLVGAAAVIPPERRLRSPAQGVSHGTPFRRALRLLAADVLSRTFALRASARPPGDQHSQAETQAATLLAELAETHNPSHLG